MRETAFPIIGTAAMVLGILPAFAVAAKLLIEMLERTGRSRLLGSLELRYAILVSSTMVPVCWLLSAGVHQSEADRLVAGCLLSHRDPLGCDEPVWFVVVASAILLMFAMATIRRRRRIRGQHCVVLDSQLHRVTGLVASNPELSCLLERISMSRDIDCAIEAHGWFRPRVTIGCSFAEGLSDAMLTSALAHEAEHIRRHDPLRYALLDILMAANPVGALILRPHTRRWFAGQEAACDRSAVVNGSSPLLLAQTIVLAARPRSREATAVGLNALDCATLKFRVAMLIAFSERKPAARTPESVVSLPLALVVSVLAILLPHFSGTHVLDAIHSWSEVTAELIVARLTAIT